MDAIFCEGYQDAHGRCCDSCHEDEDEGYDTLWSDDWLHCCCQFLRGLGDANVSVTDEAAVRAYLATIKPT